MPTLDVKVQRKLITLFPIEMKVWLHVGFSLNKIRCITLRSTMPDVRNFYQKIVEVVGGSKM